MDRRSCPSSSDRGPSDAADDFQARSNRKIVVKVVPSQRRQAMQSQECENAYISLKFPPFDLRYVLSSWAKERSDAREGPCVCFDVALLYKSTSTAKVLRH